MGCWHGYHRCGPWFEDPYSRGWYGPADWYEGGAPRPWRHRRSWRLDRETAADALEARLEELRDELRAVEDDLARLRAAGPAGDRPWLGCADHPSRNAGVRT